jgi:hypothetical protein
MHPAIPTIHSLPTSAREAGYFIWKHQDALNAFSHEHKKGTIELGQTKIKNYHQLQIKALKSYSHALLSECSEFMENFVWKAWSKEAKAGKRWCLSNPNAETGKGTIQNVRQDIIDLISCVTSIMQTSGFNQQEWEDAWAQSYPSPMNYTAEPHQNMYLADLCSNLAGNAAHYAVAPFPEPKNYSMLNSIFLLCQQAGMNWLLTSDLYAKKLVQNYERQIKNTKLTVTPEIEI